MALLDDVSTPIREGERKPPEWDCFVWKALKTASVLIFDFCTCVFTELHFGFSHPHLKRYCIPVSDVAYFYCCVSKVKWFSFPTFTRTETRSAPTAQAGEDKAIPLINGGPEIKQQCRSRRIMGVFFFSHNAAESVTFKGDDMQQRASAFYKLGSCSTTDSGCHFQDVLVIFTLTYK